MDIFVSAFWASPSASEIVNALEEDGNVRLWRRVLTIDFLWDTTRSTGAFVHALDVKHVRTCTDVCAYVARIFFLAYNSSQVDRCVFVPLFGLFIFGPVGKGPSDLFFSIEGPDVEQILCIRN